MLCRTKRTYCFCSVMGITSLDFQPGYVSMSQAVLLTVTADGFPFGVVHVGAVRMAVYLYDVIAVSVAGDGSK